MSEKYSKYSSRKHLESFRILRASLEHFVCLTPGFHKNSYGEIQFCGTGSRSSYAPFVTCDASTSPELIQKLITEQWMINFPKIIILVNGEFPKRDYSWLNVMNESWLITNGSSPSHQRSYNSSTIAILNKSLIYNRNVLTSSSNKGLFPAPYFVNKRKTKLITLDQTHTHFIFVEETPDATVGDFRRNFLRHIGSIPLEFDTNATSFVTIPIVTVLVSDDMEALVSFSNDVLNDYPFTIMATCHHAVEMLKDAKKKRYELTHSNTKKFPKKSSILIGSREKDRIVQAFNRCAASKLRIYPSQEYPMIRLTLLKALKESGRYSVRSCVRLSMIWDNMDVLKELVYSRKQFEGEDDYMSVYLFAALSLDRAEFLEYLQELGVDMYSKLTIRMLWSLYYETIYNDQYETETSFVIRKFVDANITRDMSELLPVIGRLIGHVTKQEVDGLYAAPEYRDNSFCGLPEKGRKFSAANGIEDFTLVVPHADRDLFLWCLLFGKTNLAKLFYKNGSNFAASALIASAILRGQAEMLDFNTQDSALADDLHERSKAWSQVAIDFVEASFRIRKQATLCMLTQKLPEYGGCSALHLGYVTKNTEFIAQPAPQSALDYIWQGKTKKNHSKWKTLAAMMCPLLVPCLNIVDRTNHFVPVVSQVYQSTYTRGADNESATDDHEAGLGAGVVYVMQTISKTANEGKLELPKRQINRCAKFSEDIFDYFNSPSVKFLVHSMFLLISMIILSLVLLLEHPPYFSLHKSNVLSFLVFFYMIGSIVDEIRQIGTMQGNILGIKKVTHWLSDGWNRIDLLMVITFFIGKALTFAQHDDPFIIKIFFSLTLLFMAMRCFQIYLVFPVLGPKIYMMLKMFKDVQVFLSIMALVFLSYGVILGSLTSDLIDFSSSPNATDAVTGIYNKVLREPYWQIYGNALGNAPDAKSSIKELIPAIVTAFYILFANLLMVNLLIAMFSYTFQNIQDNAFLYWKFHRFEVVKEFWDRPWLASPFILIEDIVRFLQWFHNKKSRGNQAFNRPLTMEQKELLNDFEKEVQTILTEKTQVEEQIQNSLKHDVKQILKKIDALGIIDSLRE